MSENSDSLVFSNDRLPFKVFGNPISKRRIFTALQTATAVCLSSVVLIFHEQFSFLSSPIALLCPILAGMTMGLSHWSGSTSKNAGYLLSSAVVGCSIGFPLSLASQEVSRWLGVAVTVAITFLLTSYNSFWDPAYARINFVKFVLLDVSVLAVFPGPKNVPVHPAVQLLFVHSFSWLICTILNLFTSSLPVEIAAESSFLIHNCGTVTQDVIRHLRFIKKPSTRQSTSQDSRLLEAPAETEVLLDEIDYDQMQKKQQRMQEAEHVILRQLETIRLMLKDCSDESWLSPDLVASLQSKYDALEQIVQLCMAMRLAVEDGFYHRLAIKILRPLRSRLDEMDRLVEDTSSRCSRASNTMFRLAQSGSALLAEPDDLSIRPQWYQDMKQTQKSIVKSYETVIRKLEVKGALVASPSEEVTRMNFVLHSLFSSRKLFRSLHDSLSRVSSSAARDRSWTRPRSMGYRLIKPFTDFVGMSRWFIALVFCCGSESKPSFASTASAWKEKRGWEFPLRLSIAVGIACSLCVLIDTFSSFDLRTFWVVATSIFVSSMTVGASIRKGLHRLIGTLVAAAAAGVLRFAVAAAAINSSLASALVLVMCTFSFVFASTYTQHSSKYPKPYQWVVASFTFQLVIFFGYPYTEAVSTWWVGPLRAGHVILGDIIALMVPLIFRKTSLSSLRSNLAAAVGMISLPLSYAVTPQIASEDLRNECSSSLQTLAKVPFVTKEMLKEAKTELKFSCRASSIPPWQATLSAFGPFSSTLSTLIRITSSKGRFAAAIQPEFVELVQPSLEIALEILQNDSTAIANKLESESLSTAVVSAERLRTVISEINQIHLEQRSKAVEARILHMYARPLIRFNAFLYNIQLFLRRWRSFVDSLPSGLVETNRDLI